MDQQLPQILFLSGRSPDPRKPPFHQQFQNQRRVAPVVFLGAHLTGANLRCISDPHVVPLCRGHFHKPLTVPGGLHPDKSRCGQLPIKPLGFSRPMLQLLFSRLSSDRVQPTNLLPTGVVITSNKHHRRLLSTEWLRSSNQKHTRPPIGAFALIQSTLRFSGCGFSRISSSSLKQLWVGHVFFRFGTSGLQELVEAEEFAAESAGVGGPSRFAGVDGERGASVKRVSVCCV